GQDGGIGSVADPGCPERAEQADPDPFDPRQQPLGAEFVDESHRRSHRPHRVGRRGADADREQIEDPECHQPVPSAARRSRTLAAASARNSAIPSSSQRTVKSAKLARGKMRYSSTEEWWMMTGTGPSAVTIAVPTPKARGWRSARQLFSSTSRAFDPLSCRIVRLAERSTAWPGSPSRLASAMR